MQQVAGQLDGTTLGGERSTVKTSQLRTVSLNTNVNEMLRSELS